MWKRFGEKSMLLVIDTNILVNALKSHDDHAKSVQLMRDVFAGRHVVCVSSGIMKEYRDVLSRPHLGIDGQIVTRLLDWIERSAFKIEPKKSLQSHIEMMDEEDRIFFDTAKCLNARLVTRNYKHYPVHELVTLLDELY